MKRKWKAVVPVLLGITAVLPGQAKAGPGAAKIEGLPYWVEGDAFVGHNGLHYNNRPLYCLHVPAMILCGDKPLMRFIQDPYYYGVLMIGVLREGKGTWCQDFSDVTARYRTGRMEWTLRDSHLPGLSITLETVTHAEGAGFAVRADVSGAQTGDRLVWAFGGARQRLADKPWNVVWASDPIVNRDMLAWGFKSADCEGNTVRIEGDAFYLNPPAYPPEADLPMHTVAGTCSAGVSAEIRDAASWADIPELLESVSGTAPLVCGEVALEPGQPIYWSVRSAIGDVCTSPADPQGDFEAGQERACALAKRVVVDTPDLVLNAAASAAAAAIDGAYYPPVYVHGAMAWNIRFPGWRTMFGGVSYGWHENVKAEVAFYTSHQVKESSLNVPKADPKLGYGQQAPDSRFYGRGRIAMDQNFYNMQTQFFDCAIHDWRWTADPELEAILRPALELHAEWQKDCFDPDDDGVYESYINTWPTDSQWYNGGGAAEETAYAAVVRQALLEMAQKAGDTASAAKHAEELTKIRGGFLESLWVADRGFVGAYREQSGYRRLHEDAWLYSVFLPIDAGLLDTLESAQALYYTDWALERVATPGGGERVWTSNWVPSVWSVRELYPGDNHHLALAYCQTGMAEEAWNLFKGTFVMQMLGGPVPADFGGHDSCGTDFNDCSSMFCRALVEGLYGYVPDYPNGHVTFRPQFPFEWDHASIETPDFALSYQRKAGIVTVTIRLTREAAMSVRIPVRTSAVQAVKLGGAAVDFESVPGFNCTVIDVQTPRTTRASLEITCADWLTASETIALKANKGEMAHIAVTGGEVVDLQDPQGVLESPTVKSQGIQGRVTGTKGNHLLFAGVLAGEARQTRPIRLSVADPEGEAYQAAKIVTEVPQDVQWMPISIADRFNADVRTIFKEEYLSPRPQTCSVRIGSDGYSPWTFYYWGGKPPELTLGEVPSLLDGDRLVTLQGVPFAWNSDEMNIAFTSQWDNWPNQITFPVNQSGRAVWFLVCGSTNPMQTRIANAELRMHYADGATEKLELIPPLNFWTLSPLYARAASLQQTDLGHDYDYQRDAFCLPETPPLTVQLGDNCRANLLGWRLREGVDLERVTLETLSQEVVIGLMGISIMR